MVTRTVSYSEFAGTAFEMQSLINLMSESKPPFTGDYRVVFDKKRSLRFRSGVHASVEDPTEDFVRRYVEKYLSGHKLKYATHESKIHRAQVYPGGRTSFDFAIQDSSLYTDNGVSSQSLKKRSQVLKMISQWSDLATRLGFEVEPAQELQLAEDCKAVKLCTRFRKLKPKEVRPYVFDTLLKQRENPKSKLAIKTTTSSLVVDEEGLDLYMKDMQNLQGESPFVVDLIGEVKKEPKVKYRSEALTLTKRLEGFYNQHKATFNYIIYPAIPPVVIGGLAYLETEGDFSITGQAGGAAVVIEGIVLGAFFGARAWQANKEKRAQELFEARKTLIEFAKHQSHLKEPYGKCVILSTDKCIVKASKQKQSA